MKPDIDRVRRITDKLRNVWWKFPDFPFVKLVDHVAMALDTTDTEFEEELDKMLGV